MGGVEVLKNSAGELVTTSQYDGWIFIGFLAGSLFGLGAVTYYEVQGVGNTVDPESYLGLLGDSTEDENTERSEFRKRITKYFAWCMLASVILCVLVMCGAKGFNQDHGQIARSLCAIVAGCMVFSFIGSSWFLLRQGEDAIHEAYLLRQAKVTNKKAERMNGHCNSSRKEDLLRQAEDDIDTGRQPSDTPIRRLLREIEDAGPFRVN